MNAITNLREMSGLRRAPFCAKYGIPYRTMEDWEKGVSTPPEYVLTLLERAVREDSGKQNTYYVTDKDTRTTDEWVVLKTKNLPEAIQAAREEQYLVERDKRHSLIEIRLYLEDVEDDECTCFDYDTIEF